MLTQDTRRETTHIRAASSDPLHDENAQLVRRISQLRGALEAATRDNADLRRRLAHATRENEEPRHQSPPPARHAREPREQSRDALSEPWSRNP